VIEYDIYNRLSVRYRTSLAGTLTLL